jgi:hypothetical protein
MKKGGFLAVSSMIKGSFAAIELILTIKELEDKINKLKEIEFPNP